jgi:hypothetical protein
MCRRMFPLPEGYCVPSSGTSLPSIVLRQDNRPSPFRHCLSQKPMASAIRVIGEDPSPTFGFDRRHLAE